MDATELELPALIVRAQAAAQQRDFEPALADYQAALNRLGPDDPHLPVRIGLA